MRLRRLAACLALPLLLAAPAAAAPKKPAAAPADWSRTVTTAANGAFVLGNPRAANRLVEYFSYTCPHCAHFQAEGMAPLKSGLVRRGLLAIEYRNFVRDAFDLSAALLARCGGAARFLGNHDALFANHEPWMTQAQSWSQTPEAAAAPKDQVARITQIADRTGLNVLLGKRGLAPAVQRQCLADPQALSVVLALTAGAWDNKEFSGTPFFVLNGKPLPGVHDWERLKPLLPALPAPAK